MEYGSLFVWTKEIYTLEFISNLGIVYVVYQLLIYTFFSLNDSSKVDALIEIKSLIKYLIHYSTYDRPISTVENQVSLFLHKEKGKYMFSDKQIETLNTLDSLINKYKNNQINKTHFHYHLKGLLILCEHSSEYHQLLWRNSILLRLLK